jgi:hypothetical protein
MCLVPSQRSELLTLVICIETSAGDSAQATGALFLRGTRVSGAVANPTSGLRT